MNQRSIGLSVTFAAVVSAAITSYALEPPRPEQLERYRLDGTLAERVEAARAFGNHRLSPHLAARFGRTVDAKATADAPKVLPAEGAPRMLTLLIAFSDMPGFTDAAVVEDRILGDGEPTDFPVESLTAFYRRASYERLEITGSVLGWYTTDYPRSQVTESYLGRQALIKEVMNHYDAEGHDFSQYDNDGDGVIDYLAIIWTGAHGEWASFWWGYQTAFWNDDFELDGVRVGTYSWQWENYDWPGEFTPRVLIHETGHALGLPDYYDYDDGIGPPGGCGGLDQMDGNWGDHNAFSKWILGWLEPRIFNQESHDVVLSPSDEFPDAAVFMHGDPVTDPYAEYFIVQARRREGNDATFPTDGVLIWHVDARVDDDGRFLYDNSYTEHKLLRLMEADGLEEIERGGSADAGDFYSPGGLFDDTTTPSSRRYDGVATNIALGGFSLSFAGPDRLVTADLGSGCALWCDASVTPNAWPGLPVSFNGSLETANCDGEPTYGWDFGDGATSGDTSASHAYNATGTYSWSVTAGLEDAICQHDGEVRVCTDFRCWQWGLSTSMDTARAGHASVELADGRILVVGGGTDRVEVFSPVTEDWIEVSPTNNPHATAVAVALRDGRVLLTGQGPDPALDCELYDPIGDSWQVSTPLNHPRRSHGAITLSDGRVLVAGGVFGDYPHYEDVREVEVFDPADESWTVVGSLVGQRLSPGMANLDDGTAVIVGGREITRFDPTTDTLERAAPLPADWQNPIAVTLDDGRLLVAGIANGPMTLLWDPSTGRWKIAADALSLRQGATASKLGNGLVIVAGGYAGGSTGLRTTEFFDPTDLSWSEGAGLVSGRVMHTATVSRNGRLIIIGGLTGDESPGFDPTASIEILTRPTAPPRAVGGRVTP